MLASVPALAYSLLARRSLAFGEQGAFEPRVLEAGKLKGPAYASAPGRWSWELVRRTSAPARTHPTNVGAADPTLAESPFLYWSGFEAPAALSSAELSNLRQFFSLGGLMLVDDAGVSDTGKLSGFGTGARRELERVLPESPIVKLPTDHVVFRSFYFLRRAYGRILGPSSLEGIVRGAGAQVIFTRHDLGGALARGASGIWERPVVPGGDRQRELAIRLAVNVAMYALCSNYKDDQVHAPFLMRRRALGATTP